MLRDAHELAKQCVILQQQLGQFNAKDGIFVTDPLQKQVPSFVGPIRPKSKMGKRYTLVGIDYYTKWEKVLALEDNKVS